MKKYILDPSPLNANSRIGENLNDEQRAIVNAPNGPMLIIAGAGTGKTHTLTHRVARLLERGAQPDHLMLLTFTNKAAKEMTRRVADIIQIDPKRIWSGTFHSIANKILRQHISVLGYPESYTIIDSEDASTLMAACVAEAVPERLDKNFPRGRKLTAILSFCINTRRPLDEVLHDKHPAFLEQVNVIRDVFHLYTTRKYEMGLVDFDDLLLLWERILLEHETIREQLTEQFKYILVDEYQDTNRLQGSIIDIMGSKHGNVMVVGDDCQSIYAFRGAEFSNILEFTTRYPDATLYRLEENYRSSQQILDLANTSIAFNKKQYQKTLRSKVGKGELPALVGVKDVYQQAQFICQRILEIKDEGESLNQISILYRAHHHCLELQVELTRRGIPFVVRSGMRFFEQAHIKDVISYLRLLVNPKDELSFLRIAQHRKGIGAAHAQKLFNQMSQFANPIEALFDCKEAIPKKLHGRVSELAGLLNEISASSAAGAIDVILNSSYSHYLNAKFENPEDRKADLEQLANYAAQFDAPENFLNEISLLQSISGQDVQDGGEVEDEHVVLSSIHQAKGLEWSAVFLLWVSDGYFPSKLAMDEPEGLEEERRLFYVATTRAKHELYLCHVMTHRARDHRLIVLRPSDFVDELHGEKRLYERWEIG